MSFHLGRIVSQLEGHQRLIHAGEFLSPNKYFFRSFVRIHGNDFFVVPAINIYTQGMNDYVKSTEMGKIPCVLKTLMNMYICNLEKLKQK